MVAQDFIAHVSQIVVGFGGLFVLLAKYKDVLSFLWKILVFLSKPVQGILRWVKLARKIENELEKSKAADILQKEEIKNIKSAVYDLSSFVKKELSPNGGSSTLDLIRRIEDRQILLERKSEAFLNENRYGFFCCDNEAHNLWVNRTYARFIGCGVDELLGFGWKKFIKTDELERYSKIWRTAFQDGCEFEETVEFINVDHQRIKLHISVSAIKDTKGNTASYIGQVLPL
ncbi:MAG: hypothetical protein FMNOHCHN_03918 [Ignavibacteriaceae bacterium]|nr:hypothetical protein [Ignavibacteriaceae bacterium]